MKYKYIVIVFFVFLFTGCSSTYKVTNFPSKEKFYEEINNVFKGRESKITLTDDSVVTALDGITIKNNCLFVNINSVEKINMKIALADAIELNFDNKNASSGIFFLQNGEKIRAEDIIVEQDSIKFVEVKSVLLPFSIQLDNVKTVNYKNRWKSIFPDAMIGLLSGGLTGYFWGKTDTNDHGENQGVPGLIGGAFVGFIAGSITGLSLGFPVTYEFNK